MKAVISFEQIRDAVAAAPPDLPKYVSPLLNLANQYAQGTRPRVVGQMSDLIQQFPGRTFKEWQDWYPSQQPGALDEATRRVWRMVSKLKEALCQIDEQMVSEWVEDLVVTKTFIGLRFQEAILRRVAEATATQLRLSEPAEEAMGIDGYIDGTPVSIKPITYRSKQSLPEAIPYRIIYYEKRKNDIVIEFDEET